MFKAISILIISSIAIEAIEAMPIKAHSDGFKANEKLCQRLSACKCYYGPRLVKKFALEQQVLETTTTTPAPPAPPTQPTTTATSTSIDENESNEIDGVLNIKWSEAKNVAINEKQAVGNVFYPGKPQYYGSITRTFKAYSNNGEETSSSKEGDDSDSSKDSDLKDSKSQVEAFKGDELGPIVEESDEKKVDDDENKNEKMSKILVDMREVEADHARTEVWLIDNIKAIQRELKQTETEFEHNFDVIKGLVGEGPFEQIKQAQRIIGGIGRALRAHQS